MSDDNPDLDTPDLTLDQALADREYGHRVSPLPGRRVVFRRDTGETVASMTPAEAWDFLRGPRG